MASGPLLLPAPRLERAGGAREVRLVGRRWLDGDAPAQLVVLRVALAELVGDLRPRQLDAEVERVRPVGFDAELGEQVERVLGDVVAVAVVDVNAVVRD